MLIKVCDSIDRLAMLHNNILGTIEEIDLEWILIMKTRKYDIMHLKKLLGFKFQCLWMMYYGCSCEPWIIAQQLVKL
jgi:hypothetical protein